MPRVINDDVIDRIAEYARKGYSKSETGRQLSLDRKTVRKYWPEKLEFAKEKTPSLSFMVC